MDEYAQLARLFVETFNHLAQKACELTTAPGALRDDQDYQRALRQIAAEAEVERRIRSFTSEDQLLVRMPSQTEFDRLIRKFEELPVDPRRLPGMPTSQRLGRRVFEATELDPIRKLYARLTAARAAQSGGPGKQPALDRALQRLERELRTAYRAGAAVTSEEGIFLLIDHGRSLRAAGLHDKALDIFLAARVVLRARSNPFKLTAVVRDRALGLMTPHALWAAQQAGKPEYWSIFEPDMQVLPDAVRAHLMAVLRSYEQPASDAAAQRIAIASTFRPQDREVYSFEDSDAYRAVVSLALNGFDPHAEASSLGASPVARLAASIDRAVDQGRDENAVAELNGLAAIHRKAGEPDLAMSALGKAELLIQKTAAPIAYEHGRTLVEKSRLFRDVFLTSKKVSDFDASLDSYVQAGAVSPESVKAANNDIFK